MNRKNNTWFGFNLTQKQSVQIFILSIVGLLISIFLLMTILSSLIMSIIYYVPYYDPYYEPENYFIIQVIFGMLPYMFIFSVTIFLCLYSLIRCKKIAKYYSSLIDPLLEPKPIPRSTEVRPNSITQFCSNCGEMNKAHEKFCPNCGHQVGYLK
ncbi:MAG: zinc ribbon domain-containing protein [Candidatus Lokiarchaeota archaeon]|nr:zinc ribbon domain-containing protein [Candidatus Lokiarchaeota archaeon]